MTNPVDIPVFELIYVIVNYGMGSKVLHKAKEYGIRSGTIIPGKGTVNNSLLNFFSLYDERKEIVLMGTDIKTAEHVLIELNRTFQFEKSHHGIVFTIGSCDIVGTKYKPEATQEERGVNKSMYKIIFTIVNRGRAEDVIEAATAAGSKGGTIITARGSGIHETSKLFYMEIEPEKEMVLILSKQDVTDAIVSSIREKLELDKPGNGIIFIQDVSRAYGFYE